MSLRYRLLGLLCALSLVAIAFSFVGRWSRGTAGPPLPEGKIPPSLSGDLLHAPDGSLWRIDYVPAGTGFTMSLSPFAPGKKWATVSGSVRDGMAIKEDGSLWSWSSHYPGSGNRPITTPPEQVGTDRDWATVRHGWNYAVLVKRDGSLWFLGGEFRNGREGFATPAPGLLPVQVGSDRDWATVEVSCHTHYALKQDGTLWHWGELGHHGRYETAPQLLSGDTWSKLAPNLFCMTALRRDRSLWVHKPDPRLVTQDLSRLPGSELARVGHESGWVTVFSGHYNLIAQKADGSWWASGENHYAHLGLPHWFGHSKHVARPTRIPINLDVWTWDIGENTTTILTRDGTFYYMGKSPASARSTRGLAAVKNTINQASRWIAGAPPLFARPGEEWSQSPVEMGKLPPSVISALRSGR